MIKKLLFSFVLVSSITLASIAQICTPNVSCIPSGTHYGICPDSATGIPAGTVGVPYNEVLSMKVPGDGSDFGYSSATIVSINIDSVNGLAPGLSYACSPTGCVFPGNSNGCILISGTPTTVWNQLITVYATAHAYIILPSATANLAETNKQYRSIIVAPAGVETLDLTKFDVQQNSPNPFNDATEVRFSSVSTTNVEFKVYNMLGAVIYDNKFKADKGVNTIKIADNSFAPGVYIYSVSNGEKTITKRMIVSGK